MGKYIYVVTDELYPGIDANILITENEELARFAAKQGYCTDIYKYVYDGYLEEEGVE